MGMTVLTGVWTYLCCRRRNKLRSNLLHQIAEWLSAGNSVGNPKCWSHEYFFTGSSEKAVVAENQVLCFWLWPWIEAATFWLLFQIINPSPSRFLSGKDEWIRCFRDFRRNGFSVCTVRHLAWHGYLYRDTVEIIHFVLPIWEQFFGVESKEQKFVQ